MKKLPKTPTPTEPITVTNTIVQTIKLTIRGTEYKLTKEEAEQMRDALVKALPVNPVPNWLEQYRKESERPRKGDTPWREPGLPDPRFVPMCQQQQEINAAR